MEALIFWALIVSLVWGVIWGLLCAWLAGQKGRDEGSWFILGFFFALIALIVLGFSPSADELPSNTATCPRCAETIKAAAVACRFCGYELSDDPGTEWYCEKCGSVVDESARFCPMCGDPFEK